MTDTDTASYLSDFKRDYLEPIKKAHLKYQESSVLPISEQVKAEAMATKYYFLSNFVACVEKTLEENFILKQNQNAIKNN